jgi:glucose-1-phosphate cytidylyltransferase
LKVIILAGGLGTRISEETEDKPKPMVLINSKPLLWHLMNIFANQGYNEFIIATGYKGEVIQQWVDELKTNSHESSWKINVLETGQDTQTGGRIAICMRSIPGERIIATYGDGLANVQVSNLIKFHELNNRLATVTAVRPPARFGVLEIEAGEVKHFGEKNQSDAGWINGGFFLLEPKIASYVHALSEPFESGALPRLVEEKQLMSFHHNGFWKPMDTLRERNELIEMAKEVTPPWLASLDD